MSITISHSILCLACLIFGQTSTAARDPALPPPLDLKVADTLLSASPFTRSLNAADTLSLTGIATIGGKVYVTVFDSRDKSHQVLSGSPNSDGWKLVEASPPGSLESAYAKVYANGELFTIRFKHEQLHPNSPGRTSNLESGRHGMVVAQGTSQKREGARRFDPETESRFKSLSDPEKIKVYKEMRNFESGKEVTGAERSQRMRQLLDEAERRSSRR